MTLESRLRELLHSGALDLPLPGGGETALRHQRLAAFGREDLTLARMVEAHTDAVAILAEAGRVPVPGALYGVWASEIPNQPLHLNARLNGSKSFCTGAGLVDRALVTAGESQLVDVDLRVHAGLIRYDFSAWIAAAFCETHTANACFDNTPVAEYERINGPRWYLERPGFWHGACGPAACWAGGALGLIDYALRQSRQDAHTMAHLGAIAADGWGLEAWLQAAGSEIDAAPMNSQAAMTRALTLRHLVESACRDVLDRFARAYGPRPLALDADASRRYQELDLYIRQCHGERDLEVLGRAYTAPRS